ncbi:MAG: methionyl-tRNA formyltransferase [Gammaproteobacteria bacterium RIFCSPHIGHO2_12_FULL_38_11]|nr:MAG: methionyl-tRNA formyltransferase [Gammaproteobacteria bacterium RIFCSPHIGHO2_12_FULL_38_11]
MSFKIIFAGTPEFAVPALKKLLDSDHQILTVLTQPDRPAGRGQKLCVSPIKQLAQENNIKIDQPTTLKDVAAQKTIMQLNPDIIIVVAYGMILPKTVLNIPRFGCINIHPSLLPKWRGAAPIQRAIEAGDTKTGVTIMQLNEKMDAGDILLQESITLNDHETSGTIHHVLSELGATLLLKTLNLLEETKIKPMRQNNNEATYANKIEKSEAIIHWKKSATEIHNQIRAFNPWPICTTYFQNQSLRIFESFVLNEKQNGVPGTLVSIDKNYLHIATGNGTLGIKSIQLPGKKQISAADFIHGHQAQLIVGKIIFG